ncbi:MAG: RnfABCDGE type electron transport complex subunit D [Angelakisella sp.]|nr:RnfABCDGE type electron transport complex subunit D [Angelakisella sp.]
MRLTVRIAPHIRNSVSNKTVMGDALITLLALYFIAWYYYGIRAVVLGCVSVATCWVADALCTLLRKAPVNRYDYSPAVTGLIIPLLLPASVEYKVVVAAGLFAICIVKQAFGGLGSNIFNPAAGGLAFVIACWGTKLFSYPSPFSVLPVTGVITEKLTNGAAYTLSLGGVPPYDTTSIVLGLLPGPMGTTNILVVGACLLYLMFRGTVRFTQSMVFLGTAALWAAFLPRIPGSPLMSVFYELCATPLLFAAAFLFSDPVTTPRRWEAKLLYASISGALVMLLRVYGGFEMMLPFAILLCNALVPALDDFMEGQITKKRRVRYEQSEKLQGNGSEFDAIP